MSVFEYFYTRGKLKVPVSASSRTNSFTKALFFKLPDKGTNASLEVLFFIHGGAFMYGGGTYLRADYMLQEDDAVFVFINYRLGPFGKHIGQSPSRLLAVLRKSSREALELAPPDQNCNREWTTEELHLDFLV